MRESSTERYLHRKVEHYGGTTRKFVSPGRRHAPDRLAIWPLFTTGMQLPARIHFIECKAPNKTANKGQAREHGRLQRLGCVVLVLDTITKVDDYIERVRRNEI